MKRNLDNFLYKHCATCGKRIPHTQIRCEEHKIQEHGKASTKVIEL